MKSYILEGVSSAEAARAFLRRLFPGQEQPWLLRDAAGDPIAYLNVETETIEEDLALPAVFADFSGRHAHSDEQVKSVLRVLQACLGGFITDSP